MLSSGSSLFAKVHLQGFPVHDGLKGETIMLSKKNPSVGIRDLRVGNFYPTLTQMIAHLLTCLLVCLI